MTTHLFVESTQYARGLGDLGRFDVWLDLVTMDAR